MFSGLTGKLPTFKTRKALILINLQNDSFQTKDGIVVCQPQDFADRIKGMVPHFRRIGDLVWVRTEFQSKPATSGSGNSDEDGPGPASHDVPVDQAARLSLEEEMEDDGTMLQQFQTAGAYFPSSRAKAVMRRASAKTRAEQRNDQLQFFANDEDEDSSDAYLSKPRKGQPPRFFVPGTSGAAFTDGVRPLVNEEKDLVLIKHHYSAFDATPLLLSLRMRLVTHIYLCGCLSNVSIYSTAADAVRHGFEVTVVEDCMGYRSEAKHLDAMRQMADMLGVSGVDSEEIIDEVGRLEPPDAEIPIFTGPGLAGINPPQFLRAPTEKPKAKKQQIELKAGVRENTTAAKDQSSISPSPAITAEEDSDRPVSAQPLTTASESSRLPRWQDGTRTTGDVKAAESRKSVLGPGDKIGEGDSKIIYDALPSKLAQNAFEMVCKEVEWQAMHHRNGEVPRRVAVQGEIDKSGNRPIYRHPADESPPLSQFSPTVLRIRDAVQKLLHQPFNHALIQLYRSGQDNISEHSDKVRYGFLRVVCLRLISTV
jgi:nicotinamidase-related amidase